MPFQKGNPGRPKGVKNKRLKEWDALGERIAGQETERFGKYMEELWEGGNHKDYADLYLKVLDYFKPRISRTEVKAEISQVPQIFFDWKDVKDE